MDKNNQLARIINLLNEHGYEINGREIDETNAFDAVDLVLTQIADTNERNQPVLTIAMPKLYQTSCSAADVYCDPQDVERAIKDGCKEAGITVFIMPGEGPDQ